MFWCGLLVLIIALASHGDCRSPRIAHGRNATVGDFPYQASIQDGEFHLCGGAIISEKHILTAAHCVFREEPTFDFITVLTGTSYRSSGKRHNIAKITVHPEYRSEISRDINDIAVIELEDRIVFDESQQKINLPQQNFEVGKKATVTGWGISSEETLELPEVLQALATEIVPVEECGITKSNHAQIYDTLVCVQSKKNSGVCDRDSGSPLAANGELVGIVSWALTPCRLSVCGKIVANTNVYKFKDFIESAMQ